MLKKEFKHKNSIILMNELDIFSTLKSFANGSFEKDNIVVFFKDNQNKYLDVTFPVTDNDCQKLLSCSKLAYFGKNDQAVLDMDYRFAYVLQSNEYITNFDPNDTNIIDIIQSQMNENSASLKFVKDKLNIYIENGHFKIHKDTPRSSNMIGTLVVCFPSEFVGGGLNLYTNPVTEINFDKLSKTHFQWCAFYGDIDHEVLKVESGNRITVTYQILKTNSVNEPNKYAIDAVKKFLNDPTILPNGGFLGYTCKYLYSDLKNSEGNELNIFKGQDYIIYNSFCSLGIKPQIEHIMSSIHEENEYMHCDVCGRKCMNSVNRHRHNDTDICFKCSKTTRGQEIIKKCNVNSVFFIAPEKFRYFEDASGLDNMIKQTKSKRIGKYIYWINNPYEGEKESAIEADVFYGNDPTTNEVIYKRCTLFINIPSYELRKNEIYVDDKERTIYDDATPETSKDKETPHRYYASDEENQINNKSENKSENESENESESESENESENCLKNLSKEMNIKSENESESETIIYSDTDY